MKFYSRKELVTLVGCDEGFLITLERERIVHTDIPEAVIPEAADAEFSEIMLERARVARTLMQDLDVNLEGAEIILRMREEIASLHRQIVQLMRR